MIHCCQSEVSAKSHNQTINFVGDPIIKQLKKTSKHYEFSNSKFIKFLVRA